MHSGEVSPLNQSGFHTICWCVPLAGVCPNQRRFRQLVAFDSTPHILTLRVRPDVETLNSLAVAKISNSSLGCWSVEAHKRGARKTLPNPSGAPMRTDRLCFAGRARTRRRRPMASDGSNNCSPVTTPRDLRLSAICAAVVHLDARSSSISSTFREPFSLGGTKKVTAHCTPRRAQRAK
jgi:hypothetical protein